MVLLNNNTMDSVYSTPSGDDSQSILTASSHQTKHAYVDDRLECDPDDGKVAVYSITNDPTEYSAETNAQPIHLTDEDLDIVFRGYRRSMIGSITYWTLVACTAGLLYVVDSWFNTISIWFTLRSSPLSKATFIQVVNAKGRHISLERLRSIEFNGTISEAFGIFGQDKAIEDNATVDGLRMVSFRHYRFVFHPRLLRFVSTTQWKAFDWSQGRVTGAAGLNSATVAQRAQLFGTNNIEIEEKSYARLLWEEVLNPFYVFQIASVIIWCCENYYSYAICIFVISVLSITITLITTKRTVRKMREMSAYACPVSVLRDGRWVEMSSQEIVAGDIIDVAELQGGIMPCDAVLLEGDCIVNESMLTGESIPESKAPLVAGSGVMQELDVASHTLSTNVARHIVFTGTRIIRVRKAVSAYATRTTAHVEKDSTQLDELSSTVSGAENGVRMGAAAMVVRTGFNTTKGSLVRSILFPRPTRFRFYRDAFRFVGVLAAIAVVGFIVNTANLSRLGVSAGEIAKKALDLITVIVPPALPASMSVGMVFAAHRLRSHRIFTISPSRINVASKVSVMCFDKTGTLTEEGLDLLGVQPAAAQTFSDMQPDAASVVASAHTDTHGTLCDAIGVPGIALINALASCHSLRLVDGEPIGDPLEVKMLEFTNWALEENDTNGSPHKPSSPLPTVMRPPADGILEELGILKCFEFSPSLRRASVIAKRLHAKHAEAYVKGAPEVIRNICTPDSIPPDFEDVLDRHTQSGYRVIAVAGKPLTMSWRKVAGLTRADVERDLVFMGFLVFENRLKDVTKDVLDELRNARIRMVMCTGDNPLTAINVARECSLIAHNVRVFVAYLENGLVRWTESTRSGVALDPATLEPFALDAREGAIALAGELRSTGKYCFALTGDVFRHLVEHADKRVVNEMLMRGAIFARMSPEQKAEMIDALQGLGHIAGFCGDGANDCTALRTAEVGISLSEAEASVAAPFTSHVTDIRCVPQLIKEGRCSIATSFSCFKYMALYSMIQFTSCCLLYIYNANLTDGQYLFVDLFTIIPVSISMSRTRPFKSLVAKRPSASLTSKKVLTSLIGNTIFVIAFQVAIYFMTEAQPWYRKQRPEDPNDPDSVPNEGDLNTSIYLFSMFQYLFIAWIFNIGPPYRQPAYRNYIYSAVVAVVLIFDLWVLLVPVHGFFSLFGIMHTKVSWRFVIFGMAAANLIVCYLCEKFLFPNIALPIAKCFRLVRIMVVDRFWYGAVCRSRSKAVEAESSQDEKACERVSDSIEAGLPNSCLSERSLGLWDRLGKRKNRKPYKYLVESMVGGTSWH